MCLSCVHVPLIKFPGFKPIQQMHKGPWGLKFTIILADARKVIKHHKVANEDGCTRTERKKSIDK